MLLVALIIITIVILVAALAGPFRRPHKPSAQLNIRELEEVKLSKYRELHDLALDWHTGKLSDADYQRMRAQLRSEAAELLDRSEASSRTLGEAERASQGPRTAGENEGQEIEVRRR